MDWSSEKLEFALRLLSMVCSSHNLEEPSAPSADTTIPTANLAHFMARLRVGGGKRLSLLKNIPAMRESEISEAGMIVAAFLALIATVGTFLTSGRQINNFDWVWIGVFSLSLITLSGAVVNFDFKRLIK